MRRVLSDICRLRRWLVLGHRAPLPGKDMEVAVGKDLEVRAYRNGTSWPANLSLREWAAVVTHLKDVGRWKEITGRNK